MPLSLYGDPLRLSPYVFTVFVALREKGLAFEMREVAMHEGAQKSAGYRAASLTGRVPALDHDGFVLAESSAIVEYLDDVFAAPRYPLMLPHDPRERARARQVMAWLRSDLGALREERPTRTMFYERSDAPLSPAGEVAAAKLLFVADRLVPEGATRLFSTFSVADADLSFMVQRLVINGYDVPAKVRAFAEAQWQRPSVRAWVEPVRPAYVPYQY